MLAARFDRSATVAFALACATLLLCGAGFRGAVMALSLYLKKEPVELRAPLSLIPVSLGQWKAVGEDRQLSSEMIEALGTDKYLDRTYALGGKEPGETMNVHLAYYTGMIDTVPHVPDRCLVAAGFVDKTQPKNLPVPLDTSDWRDDSNNLVNLATGKTYRVAYMRDVMGLVVPVRMPVGDLELRTIEFASEKAPNARIFGGYFFIANGRATPSPEGVKALAFNISEKYAYYCKVQFIYASRQATQEEFLELVADHLHGLLPELMRCLPDWSEVERRGEEKPTPQASSSR